MGFFVWENIFLGHGEWVSSADLLPRMHYILDSFVLGSGKGQVRTVARNQFVNTKIALRKICQSFVLEIGQY